MTPFFGNPNDPFNIKPPPFPPPPSPSFLHQKPQKSPQMRLANSTPIQTTFPTDIVATKRLKTTMASPRPTHRNHDDENRNHQSLLPGLPDHIAQLCLSLVPSHHTLSSVCNSWRRLIYSPSFPPFLSIYSILLPTPTSSTNNNNPSNHIHFASFDPISSRWQPLPPLPPDPPLRLLPRHPSFISRNLPVQSVAVSGNLILLAATADHLLPALSRPLIFNPINPTWTYGPALFTPRRWCATGSLEGVVYVASGIGSHYNLEVARSVERWDLNDDDHHHHHRSCLNNTTETTVSSGSISIKNKTVCCSKPTNGKNMENSRWGWEKMGELRDAKFSREAIDAIGWRGKLCMVNVKGDAAKEGIIYNVRNDSWEEMPEGMLQGWRGPAAALDEEIIFSVDESKGVLKRYYPEIDAWGLILENHMLKGAQSMAIGGGRACVVCGGGGAILVVDVAAATPRVWVVEAPHGFEALDVHVLPRMSR